MPRGEGLTSAEVDDVEGVAMRSVDSEREPVVLDCAEVVVASRDAEWAWVEGGGVLEGAGRGGAIKAGASDRVRRSD